MLELLRRIWGFTVTVEEREPGGIIYIRAFDQKLAGGKGGYQAKVTGPLRPRASANPRSGSGCQAATGQGGDHR